MLTRSQIDAQFAAKALTPAHAAAEAIVDAGKPRKKKRPPVSEDKPRDLMEDPEVNKGKWKKIVQQALAEIQTEPAQYEDGVSCRPVHDGGVPYEDLPGDDVTSLPFRSTAPCIDQDTGKSYDFLNTVRPVTGPADICPGGLFAGKRLPPDEAPHVTPGPVSPGQFGGISRVATADQVLTTRLPGGD